MRNPLYNRLMFVCAFFGIGLAGYLWYLHATHADIPCGASGGCDIVAASRYAHFPDGTGPLVAAYGTFGYIVLTVLTFLRSQGLSEARDRTILNLILWTAGLGTLFSLRLTYMELFVLHAICKWCVASQVLILAIFLIGLKERLTRTSPV